MAKLSSVMDLSKIAHTGTPLPDLLEESLREARARLNDRSYGSRRNPAKRPASKTQASKRTKSSSHS